MVVYDNGMKVCIGDLVHIADMYAGTVVADLDDGLFSPTHPRECWAYLRTGILVATVFGGLLHYPPGHRDRIRLIRRAGDMAGICPPQPTRSRPAASRPNPAANA
jgi:hypothetical protein